jgi:hypothetical protein
MSLLNVNTIEPSTGTGVTLGASGDTITVPAGATFTVSGTATGLTNTPRFAAYSAGATISDATETTIVFGTEDIDSDSAFSSNTFTVPAGKGGVYYLSAVVDCIGGATDGLRDAILKIKEGSNVLTRSTLGYQSNRQEEMSLFCGGIFNLSAGDAITASVYIDNVGGTSSYGGGSERKTMISGFKLT